MNVSRRLALLGSTCLAGSYRSRLALAQPTCQSLGQESPPGAVITGAPSTYVINASPTPGTAGQGNIITITSGGQVAYNGTTATGTANVTSLVYIDHSAFQGNSSGTYYGPITSATSTGSTALTSPLPKILLSNTSVAANTPSGSTVGTLNVTTGLPNGTIGTGAYSWVFSVSGTTAVTVSGSSLLTNGVLPGGTFTFQVSAANANVIGSPFAQTFSITVAGAAGESAPGTTLTGTAGQLVASSTPGSAGAQNAITITSGGAIAVNGTTVAGANVTNLYYIDHSAFQENTALNWYGPITASSTGTQLSGPPQPTIVLSNSTVAPSSPAGTVVGAITVTTGLPNATVGTGAYTWALSLSGANANDFQIVSGNLETAVANLAASTYSITITATNSAIVGSPFTLPTTITVGAGTGNFKVSGGKVIAPNGSTFIGRGVALHDSDLPTWVTNAQAQPLTTLLPGINFLRVAVESYWAANTYQQQINWLTANGIVVVLGNVQNSTGQNSGGGAGVIFTTASGFLTPESNWYASVAALYTSPYVWFGTNNEPSTTDSSGASTTDVLGLWNWQLATYNAIRGAGNNNIIEIEQPSEFMTGAYAQSYNGNAGNPIFSTMTGIVFGPHFYSFLWNGQTQSVSQATIYSSAIVGSPGGNGNWGGIVQQVANIQTLTSKDGTVPCCCFEFGPQTGAPPVDTSGVQLYNAVFEAVTSGPLFGFLGWALDTIEGNQMANSTTSLTTWGSAAAAQIALNP